MRIERRYDTAVENLREAASLGRPIPSAASAYVGKVRHDARAVTDADVAALRAAGVSEDEIFALTVAAAVDVGLECLAAGLRTLE